MTKDTVIKFWCKVCGKKVEVQGMVPKYELCSVCEEKEDELEGKNKKGYGHFDLHTEGCICGECRLLNAFFTDKG